MAEPWLITVARAATSTEVVRLQLALDSAGIRYVTQHDRLQTLMGGTYNAVVGPVEFQVRPDDRAAAEAAIADSFEVDPSQVPKECPACGAASLPARLDCPACGLFLA